MFAHCPPPATHIPLQVLCVCSDESVGKRSSEDAIISTVQDVSFPTTSDAEKVSSFLKSDGNKVIFSTYHSSPVIAEAQKSDGTPGFDLVIADEAHRCTGEAGTAFTTVLDQSQIKAQKRLFATATPRTYSSNLQSKASDMGVDVTGMDDEGAFGKVFHLLSFGEAIEAELLTDYQVVIIGVDEPMVSEWIERGMLLKADTGSTTDARSLASQIGLIKAIKDYDLKRMISFHSRVKRAESFASEIHDAINMISNEHRPKVTVWTGSVSGQMSAHERRLKLDQLKELTQGDIGLLSNARCLSEGVDVPSLDGVAFIDPKSSQIDIVQAVGRAIRLSESKSLGTIVLPVFIENGTDAEASLQSSHFKPVWNVINALKSHDEVLSFELDKYRTDLGKKAGTSEVVGSFSKIIIHLPQTVDASFAESLRTYLVERTTSSWNFWFGLLEAFAIGEGHIKVPNRFETDEGYRLSSWVIGQRSNRGNLTSDRVSKLDSLGFDWDPFKTAWEYGFLHLVNYVEQEGDARVPHSYLAEGNYKLGRWVIEQRSNKDILIPERVSKLEALAGWAWDANKAAWEEGYLYLINYIQQEKHAKVPDSYRTKSGYSLGSWVKRQRKNRDTLLPEQKQKLDSLGEWIWDVYKAAWDESLLQLTGYVEQQGHARVPSSYIAEDGFRLGRWVVSQRVRRERLSPEQKSTLGSFEGWIWNSNESAWDEGISHLTRYVEMASHANVPGPYKTEDDYKLGQWVSRNRVKRNELPPEQIAMLESFKGWVWDVRVTAWDKGLSCLIRYVEQQGHARVPNSFKTKDNYGLGLWVSMQRSRKDRLTIDQKLRLESLDGWLWCASNEAWEQGLSYLTEYVEKEGHARVISSYELENGFKLGRWVIGQRHRRDSLTNEQISRLEALNGWVWNTLELAWEVGFSYLAIYVEQEGHAKVPNSYKTDDSYNLGGWVKTQRKRRNQLSPERKSRLEALNFVWKII